MVDSTEIKKHGQHVIKMDQHIITMDFIRFLMNHSAFGKYVNNTCIERSSIYNVVGGIVKKYNNKFSILNNSFFWAGSLEGFKFWSLLNDQWVIQCNSEGIVERSTQACKSIW